MLNKLVTRLFLVCFMPLVACGASDPDTQTETSLNPQDGVSQDATSGDVDLVSDGIELPLVDSLQDTDTLPQLDSDTNQAWSDIEDGSSAVSDVALETVGDAPDDANPSLDASIDVESPDNDVSDAAVTPDADLPCGPVPALLPPEAVLTESVKLETVDGKSLAATFTFSPGAVCLPGLLLVHQFNLSQQQWGDWPEKLAKSGYLVLTFDLRGHGSSDAQDGPFNNLLTDPAQTPMDLAAAMAALLSHWAVDPSRVGVIGTSIGANLAVVAMVAELGAKAVVPVSPRYSAIESLSGATNFALSNVLCLATEADSNGDQAATCAKLVEDAAGNVQKQIYDGSDHGIALLNNIPDAWDAIIGWLSVHL